MAKSYKSHIKLFHKDYTTIPTVLFVEIKILGVFTSTGVTR